MILLNFSHPLTAAQVSEVEQRLNRKFDQLLDVKTYFDSGQPFAEQARTLVDGIGFTPQQWQATPLIINPPSLSVLACIVLAEIHGRMGHFPPVLRLRPVVGSVPPQFEVAEILDLQSVRQHAREKR